MHTYNTYTTLYTYIYLYTTCLNKNCTNYFCHNFVKFKQIFNNFWKVDDKIAEVIFLTHLTALPWKT